VLLAFSFKLIFIFQTEKVVVKRKSKAMRTQIKKVMLQELQDNTRAATKESLKLSESTKDNLFQLWFSDRKKNSPYKLAGMTDNEELERKS
jgi:hypothetical protein